MIAVDARHIDHPVGKTVQIGTGLFNGKRGTIAAYDGKDALVIIEGLSDTPVLLGRREFLVIVKE